MQLSALLALLPLAAALPQSRGPVEARAVEIEARDGQVDGCTAQHDQCYSNCRARFSHSNAWFIEPIMYESCYTGCNDDLFQCNKKNATEKRSVEEAPLEARDNGSEATTDCYGHVASCEHKGTPVAECYNTLARCIQDVYEKFHG